MLHPLYNFPATFSVHSAVRDTDPKSMRAKGGFSSSGFERIVDDFNDLSLIAALDHLEYVGPVHSARVPDAEFHAKLKLPGN